MHQALQILDIDLDSESGGLCYCEAEVGLGRPPWALSNAGVEPGISSAAEVQSAASLCLTDLVRLKMVRLLQLLSLSSLSLQLGERTLPDLTQSVLRRLPAVLQARVTLVERPAAW